MKLNREIILEILKSYYPEDYQSPLILRGYEMYNDNMILIYYQFMIDSSAYSDELTITMKMYDKKFNGNRIRKIKKLMK